MPMDIRLSDHFTYQRLLRFTWPSVTMMIFTSIYGVVDGFFVSNFAGDLPFKAVNLIMPFLMILGTVGFMFGTGGTAIVAHTYGGGDRQGANRYFSLFVYVTLGISVVLAALGFFFLRPIAGLLGASGALLDHCVTYGRIILTTLPRNTYLLQKEEFDILGNGKILMNTSIGATFDINAMKEWLSGNPDSAYFCDGTGMGTLKDELAAFNNVFYTRAVAGMSAQSTARLSSKAIANIRKFLDENGL